MAGDAAPEELLALVARRDEDALAKLYDRFGPALLGLIQRIVSDRAAAEEVLEEVFVRVWYDARHLRADGASVAAWLTLLARAVAIDRSRSLRKAARPSATNSHHWPRSLAWLPRPEEVARLDERQALLKKVINQLPAAQRRELDLAAFDGYGEAEIAEKLGEPLGKAKSGLRASASFLRHRLRAMLGTWTVNI